MAARKRNQIVVQLLDGEIGAQQRLAIQSLALPNHLSAKLRSLLLAASGFAELDRPISAKHESHVWASDGALAGAQECLACGCHGTWPSAKLRCPRTRQR